MAHSMGVRVVLASIERLKELFIKPKPPGDAGGWEGSQAGHPTVDDSEVEVCCWGACIQDEHRGGGCLWVLCWRKMLWCMTAEVR